MASDDLEHWVGRIRQRRFADLSEAVWELLWLAAQHRSFGVRPRAGAGLEFTISGQEPRILALPDTVGWLRSILARMATLLKDQGAITEKTGMYGFAARINVPDGAGLDRVLEIQMKNNQQDGVYLLVRQAERASPSLPSDLDSPPPMTVD